MPTSWAAQLAPYRWQAQTEGCSDAAVYRLDTPGKDNLFIKTERLHALVELTDEEARLRWLAAQGFACPTVIHSHYQPDRGWLWLSLVQNISHCF